MSKINLGRVVLGGLVAGVVLNVFDFLVNGLWLASEWNAAMMAMGKGEMGGSMIAWFVLYDFLFGIFLVWLYAAIRPRYGIGPKTAVIAGLAGWFLVGFLHSLGESPVGMLPVSLYIKPVGAALIFVPIASVAGAWLYQEA